MKPTARALLAAALLIAAAAGAPHVVNVTDMAVGGTFRTDNATYTDGLVLDDVGNATVVLNATSIAGAGLVVRGGVGATGSLQLTNGTRVEATTTAAAALSVECLAGRLVIGPSATVSAASGADSSAVVNVTVCGSEPSPPASVRLDGATINGEAAAATNASALTVTGTADVVVEKSTLTGAGSVTESGREFVALVNVSSLVVSSSRFTSTGSGIAATLLPPTAAPSVSAGINGQRGTANITGTSVGVAHGTGLSIVGADSVVVMSATAIIATAPPNATHDVHALAISGSAAVDLRTVTATCWAGAGACTAARIAATSADASVQRTVRVAGGQYVGTNTGTAPVASMLVTFTGARSTCTLTSTTAVAVAKLGRSNGLLITGDGSAEQAVALTAVRVQVHHTGLTSNGGLEISNLGPRSSVSIASGNVLGALVAIDLFDLPHSNITMSGVVSTVLDTLSNTNVKLRGNLAGTAVTLANLTAVASRTFITALLVAPSAAPSSVTNVLRVTIADSDLTGDTSLTLDTVVNLTTLLAVTRSKLVGPCRITPGDHSVVTMADTSVAASNVLGSAVALDVRTAAENVTVSLTSMTVSASSSHGPVALRVGLPKSAAAPSSLTINGGSFIASASLFTTTSTVSATAVLLESPTMAVDASRTLTPTVVVTGAVLSASSQGGTVRGVWVDTAAASTVQLIDSRVSATSTEALPFARSNHWGSAAAFGAVVGPAANALRPNPSGAAVVADLRVVNTSITARARLAGGAVMLGATAPVTPRITITGGSVTVDVDAPVKAMTAGVVALPQVNGGDAAATVEALRYVTISTQGVAFHSPVRGAAVFSGVATCVMWLPQTMPGVWRVTVSDANVTGAGFRPQPVLCRTPNGTAPISAATQVCLSDTQRVYTEDSKTTTLAATMWDVPESLRGRVSAACALPASKAPPSETKSHTPPGIDIGDLGLNNNSPSTGTFVIIVVIVGVVGCGCVGGIALISWCVCCRESRVPHRTALYPPAAGAPAMAGQQQYPQHMYPPQHQMQHWSNSEVEMTQAQGHPGVPAHYKPAS